MKQFASLFTHGVRNGAELRRQVHTGRTTQEVLDRVDEFFARQRDEQSRVTSIATIASPLEQTVGGRVIAH